MKQGFCHTVAVPSTLKRILREKKEDLWKLKYFTMQKYNLQNSPLKETKILQVIITQSQVTTQAKITSSLENPHIKIDLLYRGQNPLSY